MYDYTHYLAIREMMQQITDIKPREHKQGIQLYRRLRLRLRQWTERPSPEIDDECLPLTPSQVKPNA
jgi:hypothetical protein